MRKKCTNKKNLNNSPSQQYEIKGEILEARNVVQDNNYNFSP